MFVFGEYSMMRILWKTEKERSVAMLLAWTAVLIFFFFFMGETPIWAEQIESYSHTSSNVPCPNCKEPLTVVSTQEATCTVRGFIEYKCDECNQYHEIVYGEEYAPHSWKQIDSTKATCTKSGSITRQCSECRVEEEVSSEAALGHDYQDNVVAPTCSEIGYTDHTCSRCPDTKRDSYTAKLPHTYSETLESEPTCQTVGFLRHICQVCNHSYSEEVPVVEHDWNIAVVEATHAEQGFTVYSCRFCETMQRGNFTQQRPYNMVWTVQDATCTANGMKIGYCSDGCGHTETVVIPRLNHDFGQWMAIRNADEAGDGIESRVCSRCELSEMKYIPYEPKAQVEKPASTVNMNWLALGSLAVLSIVAVIFVVVFLLLLLEHARRDRIKRSRRVPPSVTYSGEL